jgi:N-acetylmuramoyl-L-alanine amidase
MYKLLIDAGHGSQDTGATTVLRSVDHFQIVKEKDLNLVISSLIDTMAFKTRDLVSNMTRFNDKNIDFTDRVDASEFHDLMISIHCNSFRDKIVNGYEIWHNGDDKDMRAAQYILNEYETMFPNMRNRGLKKSEKLYILKASKCPVVIIECGFISNQSDLTVLINPGDQIKIAKAIIKGAMNYFKEI